MTRHFDGNEIVENKEKNLLRAIIFIIDWEREMNNNLKSWRIAKKILF